MNEVKKEIDQHIRYLLQRHGLTGAAAQRAQRYMVNGFSNEAAIRLAQAGGDHRVLLRRAA